MPCIPFLTCSAIEPLTSSLQGVASWTYKHTDALAPGQKDITLLTVSNFQFSGYEKKYCDQQQTERYVVRSPFHAFRSSMGARSSACNKTAHLWILAGIAPIPASPRASPPQAP